MEQNNNIALFFGSFNPIHIGHLCIASFMAEFTDIEELWFIISPQNPLKSKNNIASETHRFNMVKMAVDNDKRFKVCDIEFNMPKPSYTIDTLTKLKQMHHDKNFKIVIGTDILESLHKWKEAESIINDYNFYVYPRLNYKESNFKLRDNFKIIKAPIIEISSTFIRKAILENKKITNFIPENVYQYILNNKLYK